MYQRIKPYKHLAISLFFSTFVCNSNDIFMDGIILILLGYYILTKLFGGGSNRKKKRRRRKSTFWGDTSTYSDYDAWSHSHGPGNKLF
jgi:putative Mn2+ efflux pump MntP